MSTKNAAICKDVLCLAVRVRTSKLLLTSQMLKQCVMRIEAKCRRCERSCSRFDPCPLIFSGVRRGIRCLMHGSLLQSICYYLKRSACSECNINIKESNASGFKSTFSLLQFAPLCCSPTKDILEQDGKVHFSPVKRFEPRPSQRIPHETFKLQIFSTYRAKYTALWPWCVCTQGIQYDPSSRRPEALDATPDPIRKDRRWRKGGRGQQPQGSWPA